MADLRISSDESLVRRLADGFGALLEQVEELEARKAELEKILDQGRDMKVLPYTRPIQHDQTIITGIEALRAYRKTSQQKRDRCCGLSTREDPKGNSEMPPGHPAVTATKQGCPFASMIVRPPSPPSTGAAVMAERSPGPHVEDDRPLAFAQDSGDQRCPIRLLDSRSPEEIADYFQTHRHEIPRSHEVCVRRYQRNEESIRQLDSKYGDLVNMIKGLGAKHKPLLPRHEEVAGKDESDSRVEHWADSFGEGVHDRTQEHEKTVPDELDGPERQPRFDRPLREIRVGESPSRPWGIHVPAAVDPVLPDEEEAKPGHGPTPHKNSDTRNKSYEPAPCSVRDTNRDVVFNGPVFIGYTPENAAEFLKLCGQGG